MKKCTGSKCNALSGIGHSDECIEQHESSMHFGAGSRHTHARIAGYKEEPPKSNYTQDEQHAWTEGNNKRREEAGKKAL